VAFGMQSLSHDVVRSANRETLPLVAQRHNTSPRGWAQIWAHEFSDAATCSGMSTFRALPSLFWAQGVTGSTSDWNTAARARRTEWARAGRPSHLRGSVGRRTGLVSPVPSRTRRRGTSASAAWWAPFAVLEGERPAPNGTHFRPRRGHRQNRPPAPRIRSGRSRRAAGQLSTSPHRSGLLGRSTLGKRIGRRAR
jgi:hypothetical protein